MYLKIVQFFRYSKFYPKKVIQIDRLELSTEISHIKKVIQESYDQYDQKWVRIWPKKIHTDKCECWNLTKSSSSSSSSIFSIMLSVNTFWMITGNIPHSIFCYTKNANFNIKDILWVGDHKRLNFNFIWNVETLYFNIKSTSDCCVPKLKHFSVFHIFYDTVKL